MIFSRKTDDNLASLAKQVDELMAKHKEQEFRGVFHVIGEDRDEAEETAKKFGAKLTLLPVTVPAEFEHGPANWGLSPDADLTVFTYVGKKVVTSHAFAGKDVNEKAVKEVLAAITGELLK
ncbi:MAG: hypothetical protein N2C14_07730 [Planctomycetales bacterium]